MKNKPEPDSDLILYLTENGRTRLQVRLQDETVWLSLNQMVELFQRDKSVISRHIKNVFDEGELVRDSVVAESATTAADGKTYQVEFYNLDVIIAEVWVGIEDPDPTVDRQGIRYYDLTGATCHLVVTADTVTVRSPGAPLLPITLAQMQDFTAPMYILPSILPFWQDTGDVSRHFSRQSVARAGVWFGGIPTNSPTKCRDSGAARRIYSAEYPAIPAGFAAPLSGHFSGNFVRLQQHHTA